MNGVFVPVLKAGKFKLFFGLFVAVSNLTLIAWVLKSYMTKFEAIIFGHSMTPYPHDVWSPASSASFGIRTHNPHTR